VVGSGAVRNLYVVMLAFMHAGIRVRAYILLQYDGVCGGAGREGEEEENVGRNTEPKRQVLSVLMDITSYT
jgi:hypothetical protein